MKTWNKVVIIAASIAIAGIVFAAEGDIRISSYMRHLLQLRSPGEVRSAIDVSRSTLGVADWATNTVLPLANGGTGETGANGVKYVLGIWRGTNVFAADGTVTNDLGGEYSVPPVISITMVGAATNATITALTKTNFIASGTASAGFHWIAIGLPL